ncbi:hypothetical protein Goshw_023892 [Gossypium schwendimanii]|uniref:Uncharacterized protein n=2 Tax=Gossypium TaxID=3633 RepID=A0A7J9N030_GOSSC|nr:hypothetical protein [Gossypium schwendimanii]
MFETFNVPGLYIAVNYVLALAVGYTTSKLDLLVFSSFAPRHIYALRLTLGNKSTSTLSDEAYLIRHTFGALNCVIFVRR